MAPYLFVAVVAIAFAIGNKLKFVEPRVSLLLNAGHIELFLVMLEKSALNSVFATFGINADVLKISLSTEFSSIIQHDKKYFLKIKTIEAFIKIQSPLVPYSLLTPHLMAFGESKGRNQPNGFQRPS